MGICDSSKKMNDIKYEKIKKNNQSYNSNQTENPQHFIDEIHKNDSGANTVTFLIKKQKIAENNIEKITEKFDEENFDKTLTESTPIQIDFISCVGEKEINYYVKKKTKITIQISENNNSKWSFIESLGMTDYHGYSKLTYNNNKLAALFVRVSSNKETYLIKSENFTFEPEKSGKLIFFPNLDPNEYSQYCPTGSITIKIKGGYQMDNPLPYYKFQIQPKNKVNSIEELEIINYINKARTNPMQFVTDYIINSSGKYNHQEISEQMNTFTPLEEVKFNSSLTKAAIDHCIDLSSNGTTGHLGSNNETIRNRIEKYSKAIQYFGENCLFGLNNPLMIVIDMLINNNLREKTSRNNILNEEFDIIGVALRPHIPFKFCCVIVFGKLIPT